MTGPDTVVAVAGSGKNAYFPDLVRLRDGSLFAAYREGAGHVGMDGRLLSVTSTDGGRTWSAPRVLLDTPYDDRDPKITATAAGTLFVTYFEIDWRPVPAISRGTSVLRSDDGGRTWSAPKKIASAMAGPSDESDSGYRLGWTASHGAIVAAPGGALLAPLYGTLPHDKWQRASVVRSTDGGRTWRGETVLAARPGIHFQEPVLTVLRDGQLVALIRTGTGVAYLSRSLDGGAHWTAPQATRIPASSHHLLTTAEDGVLLTYGDLSGRFSPAPGRPTVGRLLDRPEWTLDEGKDVLLYDAGSPGAPVSDQANPSSVEVRPGRFLTLTYDLGRHAVVGVYSTAARYR
ncbi:sialidase family protein [Amycolatopsis sp. CA-230715]|uniref:sialidase family protein n=1 Tax=Amycolatopsis sp. CA-230715 TaxID=2745196 RepID=UPI001C00E137|nr:sialidase family protein [Amycolatopsis sp. CA-230715]